MYKLRLKKTSTTKSSSVNNLNEKKKIYKLYKFTWLPFVCVKKLKNKVIILYKFTIGFFFAFEVIKCFSS